MSDRPKPRLRKLTREHQKHFMQMVPVIMAMARKAFSDRDPEAREELTAEVVTHSLIMFAMLIEQGREALAYAAALAMYGIKRAKIGRQAATPMNVRDVSSSYCQMRKGITLQRLDRYDRDEDGWLEVLVEGKTAGPADIAASRIDVAEFFRQLKPRDRKIAGFLAAGNTTTEAARRFKVSAGRISQKRREFLESWQSFQGEDVGLQAAAAPA